MQDSFRQGSHPPFLHNPHFLDPTLILDLKFVSESLFDWTQKLLGLTKICQICQTRQSKKKEFNNRGAFLETLTLLDMRREFVFHILTHIPSLNMSKGPSVPFCIFQKFHFLVRRRRFPLQNKNFFLSVIHFDYFR